MMGLTPRQVDELTLAEFTAMFEGFAQFHGGKDPDEEAEFEELEREQRRIMAMEVAGNA